MRMLVDEGWLVDMAVNKVKRKRKKAKRRAPQEDDTTLIPSPHRTFITPVPATALELVKFSVQLFQHHFISFQLID